LIAVKKTAGGSKELKMIPELEAIREHIKGTSPDS